MILGPALGTVAEIMMMLGSMVLMAVVLRLMRILTLVVLSLWMQCESPRLSFAMMTLCLRRMSVTLSTFVLLTLTTRMCPNGSPLEAAVTRVGLFCRSGIHSLPSQSTGCEGRYVVLNG